MLISQMITALQEQLEQHGDLTIIYDSEGRLYLIEARDFIVQDIDPDNVQWRPDFTTPITRALVIGSD